MGIFEAVIGYALIARASAGVRTLPITLPYIVGKFEKWRLKTFVKPKNPNIPKSFKQF